MTEETNDTTAATTLTGNAGDDAVAVNADTAASAASVVQLGYAGVSGHERQHVADAIVAETRRQLAKAKKTLKAEDLSLLERVAANAVRHAIATRVAPQDEKSLRALVRKQKLISAQLANVRAFAADAAVDRFWKTVDLVIDRLTNFGLTALAAAV